jgi:hypothetical protein
MVEEVLVNDKRISLTDTSLFTLTDDIQEAARIMIEAARNARSASTQVDSAASYR